MDKPFSLELVPIDEPQGAEPAAGKAPAAPLPVAPLPAAAHELTLVMPVAEPPAGKESPDEIEIVPLDRAIPIRGGNANGDGFAAQASREYAGGHVDRPLWDRALAQANGDAAAAAAIYVRARGTALRLLDRDRRTDRRVRPPEAVREDHVRIPPAKASLWQRHRPAIVAAFAVAAAASIGAVLMAGRGNNPGVADGAASLPSAKAPPPVVASAPVPPPKPVAPTTDFMKKVQELRDVGNWNLLVLYAMEWTRKDPGNAVAWDQLRDGYRSLRQYEDARSAAAKATQLAPDDARLWRKLGEANLDLDNPEGALAAFEQTVARNDQDVESWQQIALLDARLGRAQESKAAFDHAAAAGPGDTTTACLRAGVAQMTPARDGYTLSRQIRAIDNRCRGLGDPVTSATK